MQIKQLAKKKDLQYVNLYHCNTVLKVEDTLIRGNLIGDHLLQLQSFPGHKNTQSQWEFLAELYNVSPIMSLSLFGNYEENWLKYCGGYHSSIDYLSSTWTYMGFQRMCEDDDDFLRQRHNIEVYLRYDNPHHLNKLTGSLLRSARRKILQESPVGIIY